MPLPVQSALQLRSVPADAVSIQVVDLQSGEAIVDWNAATARNPASTIKLLTTLAALDELGPAYRWRTEVFTRGEIRDGVLDGDLVLKGYGDPFLVTERVWQLVQDIRHQGIREIRGDLVIDDSWFDVGEYDPAAFDNQPLRAYNVAPSALLMNFKVIRYWFAPDGTGVDVRLD
ncbi:MAG: D-alanyl-D-alanine carboxypeptidase, partial [Pseudomonadota bacterium]